MSFPRLRIRTKLMIGLLAIVASMAVESWIIIAQQSAIQSSIAIHRQLDVIERGLLECRRQEKNFFLRHDAESRNRFATEVGTLQQAIATLRVEATDSDHRLDCARLDDLVDSYATSFRGVAEAGEPGEVNLAKRMAETVAHARECHTLADKIREETEANLRRAFVTTRRASLMTLVLGLLASLSIAVVLTVGIVRPLERLRELAERAASGDIQDVDVELRDLDLGRFNSLESHDLAVALQRMVTSLRVLVSSERGLMTPYHMTIVVLVSRAAGACAWALIDRARVAADLGSLSDVTPANAELFLSELDRELSGVLPDESRLLLMSAIRGLEM